MWEYIERAKVGILQKWWEAYKFGLTVSDGVSRTLTWNDISPLIDYYAGNKLHQQNAITVWSGVVIWWVDTVNFLTPPWTEMMIIQELMRISNFKISMIFLKEDIQNIYKEIHEELRWSVPWSVANRMARWTLIAERDVWNIKRFRELAEEYHRWITR